MLRVAPLPEWTTFVLYLHVENEHTLEDQACRRQRGCVFVCVRFWGLKVEDIVDVEEYKFLGFFFYFKAGNTCSLVFYI